MISSFASHHYRSDFLRWLLALVSALVLLAPTVSRAEDSPDKAAAHLNATGEACVPAEFGEVIYRENGQCPQQIFIIGQSHRSALSGQPGPETVQVQAEIYRIGEWLIQERNVGLLLPEGFFQEDSDDSASTPQNGRETIKLDNRTLADRLSDESRFVNADLLLNACYNIPLAQVEDRKLYCDIRNLLSSAKQGTCLPAFSQLSSLQDQRTLAMLQNIPGVVEKAFQTGLTANRQAMFTIGLAHIREIIDLLQGGSFPENKANETTVKLLDKGYGVTVILPKTLAENEQILHRSKLAAH